MLDIFIYICIILFGVFLVKSKILPNFILKKISTYQSIALYILLTSMGIKIGMDKKLISNLHIMGVKSFFITIFAVVFSILFVNIIYKNKKGSDKKWSFLVFVF